MIFRQKPIKSKKKCFSTNSRGIKFIFSKQSYTFITFECRFKINIHNSTEMRIISEYLGNDRSRSIEDVIGCLPKNRSLFKNKHFLLTCTITTKRNNSDVSSSTAVSVIKLYRIIFSDYSTVPHIRVVFRLAITQQTERHDLHHSTVPKKSLAQPNRSGRWIRIQLFRGNSEKQVQILQARVCQSLHNRQICTMSCR